MVDDPAAPWENRPMHPRIQDVLEYLDAQRSNLRAAVDQVPPDRREQRPGGERWSVAEILEHLATVESRVTKLVATQVAAARELGLGAETETSPIVPTVDTAKLLDRSQTILASDAVLPTEGLDVSAAWARLEEFRKALREEVLAADGLALGEIQVSHRVLGPVNLYQMIVVIGAHEARHVEQIREIGDLQESME
jgi:hypothetical protein